jgi:hypothetical protein
MPLELGLVQKLLMLFDVIKPEEAVKGVVLLYGIDILF